MARHRRGPPAVKRHAAYLAAIAVLFVALVAVSARLAYLNGQLDRACAGDSVVARLDLTEWVPVCTGRGG